MQRSSGRLTVSIRRSDPSAQTSFTIDRFEPMTVLDALVSVQREVDPSIAFRYSCRVSMCGTCTLRVNGRSVLACQTVVEPEADEIALAPAAGLPVVRDLVVDMAPFWEEWERVKPYPVPVDGLDEPAAVQPDSPERVAIDGTLDCIQCGACFSSCGIAGQHRRFIGPAALSRAMVLIHDSRDAATDERLAIVSSADGVDRCHNMFGCTNVCPKGLDPARAIRALRTGRV